MKGKALATGAMLVGAAGVALGGVAPPAHASSGYPYGGGWKDLIDPGGYHAYAGVKPSKHSKKYVQVDFRPYGEHLSVDDYWRDGRGVTAYLHVAGSGTATFKARTGHPYNLSFTDGKKVWVRICVNKGPCSGKWYGRT